MASKIIFYLLFVLDLLLAAFLGWSLFQTHLIPNVAVIIAAAMLVLIPLLLFFLQLEKKKKKTGFRVAAIVILLFLGLVEGAVAFYLHQYNSKMDDVTEVRVQYTQVEVYVKAEDPAQTIEYAVESEYVFGIIAGVDEDAIAQTRAAIEEKGIQDHMMLIGIRKDIDALMRKSKVFILPSKYEGMPLVLIEAQASGLQCVTADTFSREVDFGIGTVQWLPESASAAEWADAVEEAASKPKPAKEAVVETVMRNGFDSKVFAKKLCELYEESMGYGKG